MTMVEHYHREGRWRPTPHSPTPAGAREPDWLVAKHGKLGMVVSDSGRELTGHAIPTWPIRAASLAHRAGKPHAFIESFTSACEMNY
ncbi:hypothetical protein [Bradyrhizobium sp. ORS 285]|uniref:hypothetical protein n=1 Tax=Bradyrhizobium sp. ORS 285 TaxID=115808 RepID=UPI0002409002|nr:hypothetical protein [Bradyrhizobium sp. ORS 285]CCD89798.1 hypothetical protein BRAO285_830004 [Bradyrhizobium sp. ORS 285]